MPTRPSVSAAAIALLVAAAATSSGCGTTLTSTVEGRSRPRTRPCEEGRPTQIANGGFSIGQDCLLSENTVVGDGIDEVTVWEFDVRHEDGYLECIPETAFIDLRLRPEADLLNETLQVEGKWELGLEEIQSLELDVEQETTIDMMTRNGRPSPYTPIEIQRLLRDEPVGRIPMVYGSNAVVSWARLRIGCAR